MLPAFADEHVHDGVVQALRLRGVGVVTVREQGMESTPDPVVLEAALRQKRVLLTNDTDFLAIAAEQQTAGKPFAPILFWPQQRRSIGEVVRAVVREIRSADYDAICSLVWFL